MRLAVLCVLFLSVSGLCYAKTKIRKCCNDQEMSVGIKSCAKIDGDPPFNLTEHGVYDDDLIQTGALRDFELVPGFFYEGDNKVKSIMHIRSSSAFYIFENGTVALKLKGSNRLAITDPTFYCIEIAKQGAGKPIIAIYTRNAPPKINQLYLKCGFLISSIFLMLLLVVYSLLPELRSLGGLILMGYAGSSMMGFLFFFCLQTVTGNSIASCLTLTYLFYFFMLSSFCWTNVMSLDIWWTFRGYAKARTIHRRGVSFKFGMYCLCAWGVPLIMTIMLASLNEVDQKRLPGIIKPNIPGKGCFLESKVLFYYMYVPMLILILTNWLFFGMTVFNIWRLSRGTNILANGNAAAAGSPSTHRSQKHRFFVYLKLSVVMGLSWILEVISSFNPDFKGWYISDAYNAFIGIIIFAIFVCKKKVFKSLKKRRKPYPAEPSGYIGLAPTKNRWDVTSAPAAFDMICPSQNTKHQREYQKQIEKYKKHGGFKLTNSAFETGQRPKYVRVIQLPGCG